MEQRSRVCPVCPRCKSNKNVIPIIYGEPAKRRDEDTGDGWDLDKLSRHMVWVMGMGQYYCRSCRFEW